MTEEERRELVLRLLDRNEWPIPGYMAQKAANEIKRLEKEVARLKDEYGVLLERTTNMLDMTVR